MKTIFLTSVFAVLLSTTNLNAKEIKTYSNVETNESGTLKEYVRLKEKTLIPKERICYFYNKKGDILMRTFSTWKNDKGWINCSKYEYKYSETGKVESVSYIRWDSIKERWIENDSITVYLGEENKYILSAENM